MNIIVFGLSVTSSWGNGHASTYRALLRALHRRGHRIAFLERDVPWHAENRDLPSPGFAATTLYRSIDDLRCGWTDRVREADLVIVGSCVPEGEAIIDWVFDVAQGSVAFFDIDTPITLAKLEKGDYEYVAASQLPGFDMYLSFTGGPTLGVLEDRWGVRRALPFYCSVDVTRYRRERKVIRWDLGYLGTYAPDRQPKLEELLCTPARKVPGQYVIAGPQYPETIAWPPRLERISHIPPEDHPYFYSSQRFTLNVTRQEMIKAGYSPSVRLFEAAACAVPIISDDWDGLDTFFQPGKEILVAHTSAECESYLQYISDWEREAIGQAARERILDEHTSDRRAQQLEDYVAESHPASVAALSGGVR